MAYIDRNLTKDENIVLRAHFSGLAILNSWFWGLVLCFLIVPLIRAIMATVRFACCELALTNKRVIGKLGFVDSSSTDLPLNKIQSISVSSGLLGKIFNFGHIEIHSAGQDIKYYGIARAQEFKRAVMAQVEQYEEDRVKEQAEQMAAAMSKAMKG